ncbi:colicin immunity domain-containing protein [Sphingomonas sp. NCPPB 2930]
MSSKLISLAEKFLDGNIDAALFCDHYFNQWRAERDSGALSREDPVSNEVLSSIFCLVDLFNPAEDKEEYEFNEKELKSEISKAMTTLRK